MIRQNKKRERQIRIETTPYNDDKMQYTKANIFSKGKKPKVNPDYFYGRVELREVSSIVNVRECKIYHVNFKKGARTKLHFHSGGQTLIVTKGQGSLEIYSKREEKKRKEKGKNPPPKGSCPFRVHRTKKVLLKEGDVVYIPPKKLHTHGGIKNNNFSHIAVNFNFKGKEPKTIWFDLLDSKKGTVTKIR